MPSSSAPLNLQTLVAFALALPAVAAAEQPASYPSDTEPRFSASQPALPPMRTAAEIDQCVEQDQPVSLDAVQRAAIRVAGVSSRQVDEAVSGARVKGLLPRVNLLGIYRNDAETTSSTLQDITYQTVGNWKEKQQIDNDGKRYYLGAMLTFSFDTLAVGTERLQAAAGATALRNQLLIQVTDLFSKRKAVVLDLCSRKWSHYQRRTKELELERATGALDALTGGLLQKKTHSASRRR